MREVKSQQRRRRIRLIQAEGERTAQRFHTDASDLAIAADTQAPHLDVKTLQRRLSVECRAKLRTRLRVEHPGADPLLVMMDRPHLLIGSDPTCDLILDHIEVAAHHSFLQWVDGQLFCCDLVPRPSRMPIRLQPPNGKWLNQQPVRIGPYQLHLDCDTWPEEPQESPLDRSPRLVADFPQFGLQFKGVEQSDNQWPVNRVLTMIGRGSQCKLRLNHPSMPNVQSCLLRTKKGCWLVDITGAGTTEVNGRSIELAPIDIGDTLRLGPFEVEVVTTVFEPIDVSPSPQKNKPAREPTVKLSKSETIDEAGASDVAKSMAATAGLAASIPASTPSVVSPRSEFMAKFVQSQQSQLTLLKTRLDRLKIRLEQASGRPLSKRIRLLLDKSVNETLQTHKSMTESLATLVDVMEVGG